MKIHNLFVKSVLSHFENESLIIALHNELPLFQILLKINMGVWASSKQKIVWLGNFFLKVLSGGMNFQNVNGEVRCRASQKLISRTIPKTNQIETRKFPKNFVYYINKKI